MGQWRSVVAFERISCESLTMSYTGKVKNGVVVLPPGVPLVEGQQVEVILVAVAPEPDRLHETAEAYAVMAMAEHQLGQTNAARTNLAGGIKIAEEKLSQPGRIDWNDVIIAQLLLHEANALVTRPP